ncbi:zinc finger protein 91-like [Asterias rubens]|uniref:zinc finger protein 91-like n=1 Tax=Asterias rubens TaxID=7604 RepID=UPI0014550264|nr:zinc finger protein 91-like [Asterias rubens]
MDDPDFSVSLVKLESTNQDEHVDDEMQTTSNSIGNSKDCQLLWESLRRQSQLDRVLDTLINKTTRLVARIQAQTASEDDSEIAVQLLSQLGVLFVEVETSEDGVKEKRYTFVTDVEAQQNKQTNAETVQDIIQPEETSTPPVFPAASIPVQQEESDDDMADGFEVEQDDGSEKENTVNNSDEPTPETSCDKCHKDLGSTVMLDFHKLRHCEVTKKTRGRSRVRRCPTCGENFKPQAKLYDHLLSVHGTDITEAMRILDELETSEPELPSKPVPTPEKSGSSKAVGMEASPKVMKCEICEEYFQNRIQLRTHLIEEHDFSRQKAVSSVCEAVKLAQQEYTVTKEVAPSGQYHCIKCNSNFDESQKLVNHMVSLHDMTVEKSEKIANKRRLELESAKFACDLCTSRFSVRGRLSKHLLEFHGLLIKVVRSKLEKSYPRKSDAGFTCDLCSATCCKRYVLSRHFAAKHGLTKKQARKKTDKLYPLGDTVEATSVSTRSKVHSTGKSKAQDVKSRRSLRSALDRGVTSKTPERTSRRLAMKEKSIYVEEDEEDEGEVGEKGHAEATEDGSSQGKNMKNDKEELNGKEAKSVDQDETGSDNDDKEKADEEDKDDSEDDEEAEFDMESLEGTQKTAEQPKKKRGRPRKIIDDGGNTSSRTDDKEEEPAEETIGESPRKQGRSRKNPNPKQMEQKIPKKRGRPCWKPDPDGNYKCTKCDKTFLNLYYAKQHMNSRHNKKPAFSCSTCKKEFYFRNTFMRHLNCHKNEEMGIKFTCEFCGKIFFDKYSLTSHIKCHSAEKPYKCEFCGRGFFHSSLLNRHRNLHTKDVEYKCTICDRVFYRKGGLTYHMLSKHEEKNKYVCSICGQGFATKSTLTAHKPTHNNSRPFQCDICGQRVKTKGNLKEHMLCLHTDKRDFKCEICHKTFNRSHRLTLHLMMHRDERPHKCNLCDKAFRTRTNLRVHVKWHQDQRDYQCEQCGKTFLISGNLDRHMQTHKNGKTPRKRATPKAPPTEDIKMDLQSATTAQLPLVTDVVQADDTQYQTVQNIVAEGGFESDLPTLASIAQHLSTMNIPVFQVPNPSTPGAIPETISGPIPVTIQTNDGTCTPLPGSVISDYGQVPSHHQQLQSTPLTQSVQGDYDMELAIN